MNRRAFLHTASTLAAAATLPTAAVSGAASAPAAGRKMTIALIPGSIGVSVKTQRELNDLSLIHI